uniref:Uncharacterized protein n=1 Tax=Parascaris univalens TaxID=6257 RepID=A0A915BPE5_PARUN
TIFCVKDLSASEVASSTRFAAFVRGKGTTDDNDERERRRLEKVGQVLKEWRRRRCYGMTEVLPRLFVGSMGDATDVEQLLANKITDVVSVHTLSRPTIAVDSLNVMHLRVSDQPEVNIADHFDDAISFIHTARINNRSVLVHCLAGVSRSVCIVAAYILTVTNMSYANTLAYLANKRPCANPNFGFRMQLIKYAEKKACAERLRLQNRFGVKCCQLQQIEDEAALSKSGIVALPILCKTESEKTLPDVAPLLSSAAPRSHRDTTDDHAICRRATHKKAASSDCLLSSPRKLKPRDMAFIWRISELAYIDQ